MFDPTRDQVRDTFIEAWRKYREGIPLAGIGKVTGTITGDRDRLNVSGTLAGDGVSYGTLQALTLSSEYQAEIPDLTPLDATLKSRNHATFVVVGGQHLNELEGTAGYQQQEVTFDATAKQGARTVGAKGSLILHPDHQEVHLANARFAADTVEWTMAPGSEAAIQYGSERVVAFGQRILSGGGGFCSAGEGMRMASSRRHRSSATALV